MSSYVVVYDSRRWVRSDSTDTTIVLPIAAGGTGNTTGTATVNANLTGPITSVGNATAIASQTGTGTKFVVDTNPALIGPTTDTLQSSGNVGLGAAPSGTGGQFLTIADAANENTIAIISNSNASGTAALAAFRASADTATLQGIAHGTGRVITRYGVTMGGYNEIDSFTGNGLIIGTRASKPLILGTNSTAALTISATTQGVTVVAPITLKGYTVATLPAGTQGMRAFVTDALAPTYGAVAVGGGAVVVPVFYDGAAWRTV